MSVNTEIKKNKRCFGKSDKTEVAYSSCLLAFSLNMSIFNRVFKLRKCDTVYFIDGFNSEKHQVCKTTQYS